MISGDSGILGERVLIRDNGHVDGSGGSADQAVSHLASDSDII